MTLVAIFHHHSQNLPIVMEVSSTEKFRDCCDRIPTDWAYLMNKETGEITYTYRNKLSDAERAKDRDTLIVSQPTKPTRIPIEQSINRVKR